MKQKSTNLPNGILSETTNEQLNPLRESLKKCLPIMIDICSNLSYEIIKQLQSIKDNNHVTKESSHVSQ